MKIGARSWGGGEKEALKTLLVFSAGFLKHKILEIFFFFRVDPDNEFYEDDNDNDKEDGKDSQGWMACRSRETKVIQYEYEKPVLTTVFPL